MIRDGVQLDSVVCGDALETLRTMESNSIDALVCDPPSGIHFMARSWDHDKGGRDAWIAWLAQIMQETKRCLKPGAHALVWALPRTSHWTATALEDAGFEVRDCVYHVLGTDAKVQNFLASLSDEQCNALAELVESQAAPSALLHVFGSGFPKNTSVSKQIDRLKGAEREVIGPKIRLGDKKPYPHNPTPGNEWNERYGLKTWRDPETAPATPEAQQWAGWGSALKPSVEQWILCRKPLSEKNLAENVLKWGTGALNVDGCRIATRDVLTGSGAALLRFGGQNSRPYQENFEARGCHQHPQGRFPSHLLLSHTLLCTPRGTKRVQVTRGPYPFSQEGDTTPNAYGKYHHRSEVAHTDSDGLETVEDWECAEGCPILELSRQSGQSKSSGGGGHHEAGQGTRNGIYGKYGARDLPANVGLGDSGTAARFFQQFHPATELDSQSDIVPYIYAPKASRAERNRGCEGLPVNEQRSYNHNYSDWIVDPRAANGGYPASHSAPLQNHHPTVKSLRLMRYLVRLITPPGGVVLDCFAGSGSTLVAAVYEGMRFVGIDQDESYCTIARARVQFALQHAQMAGDCP